MKYSTRENNIADIATKMPDVKVSKEAAQIYSAIIL